MARVESVLLDRDGTILEDKDYLSDPAGVELSPGAAEGLRLLESQGLRLFAVTNQSGIGRGYFSEEDYYACHAAMTALLKDNGIALADASFCPHNPEDACVCRKPALGMWRLLAEKHGLRASASAMVGDKACDVVFGRAAGFPAVVLVLTGKGAAEAKKMNLPEPDPGESYQVIENALSPGGENLPHAVARDLLGAACFILGRQ